MSRRHESMVCPFIKQGKRMCPMASGDMPYMQNVYDYENNADGGNMFSKPYEDDYMWEEEHCPLASSTYPMMMPMPMVMEFEDDEE